MKEWIEKHLMVGGKLVSKRCTEKWLVKNGYAAQLKDLQVTNPSIALACKQELGLVSRCPQCGSGVAVHPRKFCSITCSNKAPNRACHTHSEDKQKKVNEKIKQTNLLRYGVEHSSKLASTQAKKQKTLHERYGLHVSSPAQIPEIMEKIKNTNQSRYGVDYSWQSDIVKKKSKETISVRYGCGYSSFVQERMLKATKERYGVNHASQSPEIQAKIQATNAERYGAPSPLHKGSFRDAWEQNLKVNYGTRFTSQLHYSEDLIDSINNGLKDVRGLTDTVFDSVGSLSTVYRMIKTMRPDLHNNSNRSHVEKELSDFIKSIVDVEVILASKKILDGKEIDIYIPSMKLGFEYNGTYWHSDSVVQRDYHQKKSLLARDKGINLVHLYEFDNIERNKEIILEHINGTYKPVFIEKDGQKFHSLDRGFIQPHSEVRLSDVPIFENKYHRVFGAGYEVVT